MSQMTKLSSRKSTSIALSRDNYQRLKRFGFAGESMDTAVGNLLDFVDGETREHEERPRNE